MSIGEPVRTSSKLNPSSSSADDRGLYDGIVCGTCGMALDGIPGIIPGMALDGIIPGMALDGIIPGPIPGMALDGIIPGIIPGMALDGIIPGMALGSSGAT